MVDFIVDTVYSIDLLNDGFDSRSGNYDISREKAMNNKEEQYKNAKQILQNNNSINGVLKIINNKYNKFKDKKNKIKVTVEYIDNKYNDYIKNQKEVKHDRWEKECIEKKKNCIEQIGL